MAEVSIVTRDGNLLRGDDQDMSNRGRWKKGQSGNPGGRPKDDVRLRELAQERTEAALDTLTQIMNSAKAPPAARVSAACAILDRGWGRPCQQLSLPGEGGGLVTLEALVKASYAIERTDSENAQIKAGT